MKFDVRYFMADLDIEYIKDNSEQYPVFSDYMPECVFAGSIEIACLQIKSRGWIAYPFKYADGTFSVWAWPEGLVIRITWEIPPKNGNDVPLYDFTFVDFSPITYKTDYNFLDYMKKGDFGSIQPPDRSVICKKVELVNRSSPIET